MLKLIHKFVSGPGKEAGDAICRVANDRAKGDREILEREFLLVLNRHDEPEKQKFAIVDE